VCYTAAHGNKETLKISQFNSQETSGDGDFIPHEEGGFITHKESGSDEGAQISAKNAAQAEERDSRRVKRPHRTHFKSFSDGLRSKSARRIPPSIESVKVD
jgi:hypothetical protein